MSTKIPPVSEQAKLIPRAPVSTRRILSLGISVRLFVDTSVQIFGPFLGVVAAGLGTSIVTLGALNSLRSLMGLASPLFGALAERNGYRRTMRLLLLLGAVGMFVFGSSWNLWVAALGICLMGLGVFSFAPILQAYVSAQIPYQHRARGLGTVEYAWALAGIIGLSISGILISRYGWRAPFLFLGVGLLGGFFLFSVFPAAPHAPPQESGESSPRDWPALFRRFVAFFRLEKNELSAWSAIVSGSLSVFATANITIVYGKWLMDTYDLNATQIGIVALTLGLAELAATTLVTVRGDHFGKYRSVLVSSGAAAIAYLLLPFLNVFLWSAVLGLFLGRLTFESSIVSNISLLSEQSPNERAKVLTLLSAGVTLGAAASSITGPYFYTNWGVPGVAVLSAAIATLATVLVLAKVREG